MRHTYKILDAKITNDQARNEDMIDVEVQIFRDEYQQHEIEADKELQKAGVVPGQAKPLEIKKFGYGLTETPEAINEDLSKLMLVLDTDLENAEKNAAREAAQAQAQDTISSLLEN